MKSPAKIAAVVVTFNRLELLKRCISALLAQTTNLDYVIVVDNASNDGTEQYFARSDCPQVRYRRLSSNSGGAGGFAEGLRDAIGTDAHWIWLMDDDAEPYPAALEEVMRIAENSADVYGSTAVSGENTSWTITALDGEPRVIFKAAEVPVKARVESLPFLGFLIHRELVDKIGLPDAGYFIAADDIEYCLRAQRAGARLFLAGKSRIEHPKSAVRYLHFLGQRIAYLSLPPWKRYYDTRNRLLNARRYAGYVLTAQVIAASFVRLGAAVSLEPRKLAQFWACCAGMFDGLFGIKGKRHVFWGIRQ